jgi:uncharacterized protein (TIGR02118 family)
MIRLMVVYANTPGAKFDHKYYAEKHIRLFKEKFGPFGLVGVEVDKGLSGVMPGTPAPFVTVALATFKSAEGFQKGLEAHGAELLADIPNYTDIQAQFQLSEIRS